MNRPYSALERRISLAAVVLAATVFGVLLALLPPFFESFDEAKYIGIGYNVLAGHGAVTLYGALFLEHSPLWPILLVAPSLAIGGQPLVWGQLLNGISGVGVILLVAHLGWRIRPSAGGLAAAVMAGFVYLHDLTRTARLDVPAAALALGYIAVGLYAFERRSNRWAALAGVILGLAFLIKEIALPFAPVPVLAALLWRPPGRTVVRLSGWIILLAAITSSWWFLVVADYTGRVYRLGTPAWTLIPLALLLVGGSLAAIGIEALADSPVGRRLDARARAALGGGRGERRGTARAMAVYGAAALWFVLQLAFYATSPQARLPNLLDLAQLRSYLATWQPALSLVGPFSAFGIALASVPLARSERGDRTPLADLALGLICSFPLVLLVAILGEPPRNYLAQIGLAVALAAGGWMWLAELVGRRPNVPLWVGAGALVGLAAAVALVFAKVHVRVAIPAGVIGGAAAAGIAAWAVARSTQIRTGWPALTVVPVAIVTAALLTVYAFGHRESASGHARAEAVSQVAAWVGSNVPNGSTIAFGSFLGHETGNELAGRYRIIQIAQVSARVDPRAPLGIATPGGSPYDDWIAVDNAPRNITEFNAFRASTITDRLRNNAVNYWIYDVGTATAAPTVLAELTPANGFDQIAHFTFPIGENAAPIEAYVFRVDLATLSLPTDRLYMAPDALRRLVTGLAAASPAPEQVAERLLQRVVVVPAAGADPAVMDELRRLAAPS